MVYSINGEILYTMKDELKRLFVQERKNCRDIAAELKISVRKVYKLLKEFNIKRKILKKQDLTNKTYGKLKVIEKLNFIKSGNIVWLCECNCGKRIEVLAGNLLSGGTKSCGCSRYGLGEKSIAWKGCGELSGRYWVIIKTNANKRKINFDISIEYAWNLYQKQNGKCNLSNVEMSLSNSNHTASLDRIDSSLGYIEGNVQWVHKDVNLMKNVLKQDYFIELCSKISSNTRGL